MNVIQDYPSVTQTKQNPQTKQAPKPLRHTHYPYLIDYPSRRIAEDGTIAFAAAFGPTVFPFLYPPLAAGFSAAAARTAIEITKAIIPTNEKEDQQQQPSPLPNYPDWTQTKQNQIESRRVTARPPRWISELLGGTSLILSAAMLTNPLTQVILVASALVPPLIGDGERYEQTDTNQFNNSLRSQHQR